ncbi:MAG TPA: hypothetical protein EYN79_00845 [Planctomycetes bacterium]|nr:hypothetical protein [Planctomycetota bacterium]HIN80462.1 hypothetical protein [Planctomycetota bacterium]
MTRQISLTLALLLALVTNSVAWAGGASTFSVDSADVAPGSAVDLHVTLDNGDGDIQGCSYGVCHDEANLTLNEVTIGSDMATVNNGDEPDFLSLNIEVGGWTCGVVINLFGEASLPIGTGYDVAFGSYSASPDEGTTTVSICATLGSPAVAITVVVDGASLDVGTVDGTVTTAIPPTNDFTRGDKNEDGVVNVADGIWILSELFLSGPSTNCAASGDANGDGSYDQSDAVYILNYRFLGGAAPAAPFPGCGLQADQTPEDCLGNNAC